MFLIRVIVSLLAFLSLTITGCSDGSSNKSQSSDSSLTTNVTLSGRISYDFVPSFTFANGLDYSNIVQKPVRGVNVQAVLIDGTILASNITNDTGNYTLEVPANNTIRVRVPAQIITVNNGSWDAQVIDNTNDNALYVLDGDLLNTGSSNSIRNLNAASGWGGSGYINARSAAPFAILDSIYSAMQLIYAVDSNINFPPLTINWSTNNRPTEGDLRLGYISVSFYDQRSKQIYLLGKENIDTDEYDRSVIIHEWAHYFEDSFSRSDSVGGSHTTGDQLDMRVAFSEGWSTAVSGMVLNSPIYQDTLGIKQESGYHYSIDDYNVVNPGWYNESSISTIIYNLFDDANDETDASSLGFSPLYNIMINQHRINPVFTSIFTFITALKSDNLAAVPAINALVESQNIHSLTINAEGSTENNSASFSQVLPIYTNLLLDGDTINICLSDYFGITNKLSNSRFLKFSIPNQGTYRIEANRSPLGSAAGDPDIYIYQNGDLTLPENSREEDSEILLTSLSAGDYVIDIKEYTFYNNIMPRDSLACYDISLTTQ